MPTASAQYVQAQKTQPAETKPVQVKDVIPATETKATTPVTDSVEITTQPKEKKGIIKSVKTFIANIKKAFATVSEYSKGMAKGAATGAVAGSLVYTLGAIMNGVKTKAAQKAAQKAGEEFVLKNVKRIPNKLLAGIVAVGAIAVNLWNASLNATEKKSEIEHRWTGHQ